MEMTYFRTFREVARKQNITRAAEALGYAQSSITTQIQKLEREYGIPLFERHGRKLRLTSPGEELLRLAIQMLDLYDESKERVSDRLGGTLTIGTIDSLAAYCLPPYLQSLKREVPGINIQLVSDSEASLVAKVKEGEYDMGLLLDSQTADPSLRCIVVREEPLALITSPGHPLAKDGRVELTDLQNMEWIVSEESCIYRRKFEQLLREHGIAYRLGFELGNLEAIKRCVMNGLGIALIPRIAVEEELKSGMLAAPEFVHPALRLELQLLLHPQKWMSHALHTFIRLLT